MTREEADLAKAIGLRIERAVCEKGISFVEFGRRARVARNFTYQWTSGQALPNLGTLLRVCDVLDVSLNYLVYGGEKG